MVTISLTLAAGLGACASGGAPSSLLTSPQGTLTTASLPSVVTFGNSPTLSGSVTDVYSRIAGRALTCWFSTDGPLKASHVFSAEAPPPSTGTAAEITIFEKDIGAANPRGSRAYRMSLTRESDDATRLTLQAGKLPTDLAQAMEQDVLAWGQSRDSCQARVVRPPPPPPPVAEKLPQKRKRVLAGTTSPPNATGSATSAAQVATSVPANGPTAGSVTPKVAAQPR